MKLYIYEFAECAVSDGYHSGGGVIVCTSGDPQEAWAKSQGSHKDDNGKLLSEGSLGNPDRVLEVADSHEFVTVFPDQGCC